MFDLREFVMKTLRGMAKNEPGYKVNRYALGWFEKDVLTSGDLEEIDVLTQEPEVVEEIPEATETEGNVEGVAEEVTGTVTPEGE